MRSEPEIDVNQVIALNMARWRKAAGLKQDELGERLGWTNTTVSAAERSADGKRVRQFTAAEALRIAEALGVPLVAMFLPDGKDDGAAELFARLLPDSLTDSPAMTAYREALAAAAQDYLNPATDFGLIAYLRDMTDKGTRTGRAARLVDDLRAFEREYRKRQIAYFESQIAELRAGAEDEG